MCKFTIIKHQLLFLQGLQIVFFLVCIIYLCALEIANEKGVILFLIATCIPNRFWKTLYLCK